MLQVEGNMFHWALVAAAILMLLIAVRTLFVSSKKDAKGKLGWPFAIVAVGLWIYVLRDHLGELGPAVRVGLGILLVLPAVQAVADPGKMRLVRAVGGLILAVLIAGPVVQRMWDDYGLDTRPRSVQKLEQGLDEWRDLRDDLMARRQQWAAHEAQVKSEIKAYGSSWDEIQDNPEALEKVELLSEVRKKLSETDSAIAKVENKLAELS